MRTVFADAAYWIGLLNPKDSLHTKAISVSSQLVNTRIVTTEMALTEVLNALSKYTELRGKVIETVKAISNHPNVEVIPQTSLQFREALTLYATHHDKEWGLTDCASCVLMRQRNITEALTYDHHFQQMGFTALLRDAP